MGGLDESDRSTLMLIAERLAGAIALGRERQAIADRATLFQALTELSRTVNVSQEPRKLYPVIVEAVATVMSCDLVVLTVRDAAVGDYRIAAMHGGDQRYVGVRIPEGEGMSGRAIAEDRVVVERQLGRDGFPSTVQGADVADLMTSAGAPIRSDDAVIGALTVARLDLAAPFTQLELEALPIVAGHVGLAIANAELLAQVADAAIRDPLTGLFNRRHLDAALERLLAARDRLDAAERRPVAAILFDLDHFGAFNKRHGHRHRGHRPAGLRVDPAAPGSGRATSSRATAARSSWSSSTGPASTRRPAPPRRSGATLEVTPIALEDGSAIHATVSAGCSAVGSPGQLDRLAAPGRGRRPPDGQARRSQPDRRRLTARTG